MSALPETDVASGSAAPLLEVRDIEKAFPGVRALSGVSFEVRAGEVHALLGENGAGKSTLIKIISGVYEPDGGSILISGRETRFASPEDAKRTGVATIYQELLLFPELTVAESIFLGHAPRTRLGRIDWRAMRAKRPRRSSPRSRSMILRQTRSSAHSRLATASGSRSCVRCLTTRESPSWTSRPPR